MQPRGDGRFTDPQRIGGLPVRQTRNVDNIRIAFSKLSPTLPFKHLRKLSSTLLGSHSEHGRYAQYFLGHAATSVADRFYVRPSVEAFERSLAWLREQYFPPILLN